jgi:hypothetical protein
LENNEEGQRPEAVEMDFMRRTCRVSRLQRITNEEIKRRMNRGKKCDRKIGRKSIELVRSRQKNGRSSLAKKDTSVAPTM